MAKRYHHVSGLGHEYCASGVYVGSCGVDSGLGKVVEGVSV